MKKLFPILLLAALLLSACSGGETASTVEAGGDHTVITFDGENVSISGGGARDTGSEVVISAAGTYEVTGTGTKPLAVDTGDDAMDVTLILNQADLTNLAGPAIQVRQARNFRLQLAAGSENRLTSGTEEMLQSPDPNAAGAALYSADDMDIEGEGALAVCGYLNNGIGCKKDLDVNGGSLTVLAANNGIKGNNSVQIKGGSISVSAWGDGIKSSTVDKEGKGYIEISGGTVAVESWGDGVQAATELRVTGGSIAVITRGDGVTQSSKALKGQDSVLITGGSVALETREEGIRSVDGSVEITGGTVEILALGDGIRAGEKDSGVGDVRIGGGEIAVSAGSQAVKARGAFSYTGGSLKALCGSEKQAAPGTGAALLCLISGSEGDTVTAGDVSLTAQQSYKCLLLCTEGLHSGDSVSVSNGSGSQTAAVR